MAEDSSLALPSDAPKDRPPAVLEPSKRKWYPSTWRYRIEEVQPELGSKPRRDSHFGSSSSSVQREKDKSAALERPKRFSFLCKEETARDPIASAIPNRQSWERLGFLKKQGHNRDLERVQRNGEEQSAERLKKQKKREAARRRPPGVKDDNEMPCAQEGFNRRQREMTPSELYFCEICSGKCGNIVDGSPICTSDA